MLFDIKDTRVWGSKQANNQMCFVNKVFQCQILFFVTWVLIRSISSIFDFCLRPVHYIATPGINNLTALRSSCIFNFTQASQTV